MKALNLKPNNLICIHFYVFLSSESHCDGSLPIHMTYIRTNDIITYVVIRILNSLCARRDLVQLPFLNY